MAVFILDIASTFFICSFDENSRLLNTFRSICFYYLKTWLIPDLVSVLPYEYMLMPTNEIAEWFKLLKLIRVIRYFSLRSENQQIITDEPNESFEVRQEWFLLTFQTQTLLKITLNTLLLIHLFACLWVFAAR
jgi:hypothetical protein